RKPAASSAASRTCASSSSRPPHSIAWSTTRLARRHSRSATVTSSTSSSRAGARKSIRIARTANTSPCEVRSVSCPWPSPRIHSVRARSMKATYRAWYTTPPASVSSQYTLVGRLNKGCDPLLIEQFPRVGGVLRLRARLQAEVAVGLVGGHPPARGAHQEALLDQVGLDHVLQGAALLAQRRGQRFHADRAAVEVLDDQVEQAPVQAVEALRVDAEHLHRRVVVLSGDPAAGTDLGVVADPAQQPVGDARGATRAARDLAGAPGFAIDAQDPGRTPHDPLQLRGAVELQPLDDAEAVAQRRGQQASAGGGAD